MKVKSKISFSILFLVIAIAIIGIIVLLNNSNKKEKTAETTTSETDIQDVSAVLPEDHISDDENINVFSIKQLNSKDDTVTVQVILNGNVSICRYSATVVFDSNSLELIDYDGDLGVYAPIVYPGKDESGKIANIPEGGIVNLEWASATNLTKEGEIITLVFNKTEKFADSTTIGLNIKGVNTFKDDIVVEAEYNAKGLVIRP